VNGGRFRADAGTKGGFPMINSPDNGERVHSLLCGREALSNELCEAVGVLRASCRLRRKHSVFGADTANDVILRRLPYPASHQKKKAEEHTSAGSGFAIPVQGIVLSGEPQATERPSVPSPPSDDLRSGGNAPPSVPEAPDPPLKGDESNE